MTTNTLSAHYAAATCKLSILSFARVHPISARTRITIHESRVTTLQLRRQELNQIPAAARISPFIVVPGQYFRAVRAHNARVTGIDDGRMRVALEISGNQLLFRVFEDILHGAFGGAL